MKKIITLVFGLLFALNLFGQHLEYENDSKWYLGLNAGAAWNTTDVKNHTHVGWGLLLGRAFNYDYGKPLSFDLRLRYLRGKWYGQDFDSTNLSHLGTDYTGALQEYQADPGFTVNNFEADVHELGLELAIHFNRLRDRTGWDPYIFGGANVVWNRTFGDLKNQLNGAQVNYAYDSIDISKPSLNSLLDETYETPLDGSTRDYNVEFMPSLGIGLGYQVGPRFSVGIEHKTTFTLKDNFDGYQDATPRWGIFENDIYHYTGGYLRFQIRGRANREDRPTPPPPPPVDNTTTTPPPPPPCQDPIIKLVRPTSRAIQVTNQQYVFKANVKYVSGRNDITMRVNGVETTNFLYNHHTHQLESTLLLKPGANSIQVTARNNCGTDTETVTITYDDCKDPLVRFESGCVNGSTVDRAPYTVRATIQNATNIIFTVNGVTNNNFTYNAVTGQFTSNIVLASGKNLIQITATSNCGSDTETIAVTYTDCADPYINFFTGNNKIVQVDQPNYTVQAYVQNVDNKNQITFRVNGSSKYFTFNASTHVLEGSIILRPGKTVVQISTSNDCGSDTETITIEYTPCVSPVIQMIHPVATSSTAQSNNEQIRAKILNITSRSNIRLYVNGNLQNGGTFNSITRIFEETVSLNAGINTVKLVVTNDCGTDTHTFTINHDPCDDPDVQFITPASGGTFTDNPVQLIQAMVFNVTGTQQVQLYVNGALQNGGAYNPQTSLYQHSVNFAQGVNTIQIVATNDCGTDVQTTSMTYRPCQAPSITFMTPNVDPSTTNATTQVISAIVNGVTSASQIQMTVNGVLDASGLSYNGSTKTYTNTANLTAGNNVIKITATNHCGTVSKEINVIREIVVIDTPNEDDEMITICYIHANNVGDPQTMEIPLSQWPQYQQLGAQLGPCPVDDDPVDPEMTICFTIKGKPTTIQILQSEWPAYEALGATKGACPVQMMTICLNGETLKIPETEWSTYQAQGAVKGVCPEPTMTICFNGNTIVIKESEWPKYLSLGATKGECPEPKMTICFRGETLEIVVSDWAKYEVQGATKGECPEPTMTICLKGSTMEVPVSQWPKYESQGATKGECPEPTMTICLKGTTMNIPISEWSTYESQGATKGACQEQTMTICFKNKTMMIPVSQWASYQSQGATIGGCKQEAMTICFKGEELAIPAAQWPQYQAQGATKGPCDTDMEETMVICFKGKTMEIAVSQWGTYESQGAKEGPCDERKIKICFKGETIVIPISKWKSYEAQGATKGACPDVDTNSDTTQVQNENGFGGIGSGGRPDDGDDLTAPNDPGDFMSTQTITICYTPEGSLGAVTMTVPLSEWESYQMKGASLGPCATDGGSGDPNQNTNSNTNNDSNENGFGGFGSGERPGGKSKPGGDGGTKPGTQSQNTDANKKAAEEAAKKKAEEEARKAKEAAAKKAAEEAARKKEEAERKAREEAEKLKAESERKAKEAAAKKAAQEAAKKKAEEEARKREAEQKAKAEADRKAREEAAKRQAEVEKRAKEAAAKKAAEEEAKRKAEEARRKAEAERKAREEATRRKAEAEKRAKEAAAKKAAEEAAKRKAEEARRKAEAERKAREAEQKVKADAAKKAAEEAAKRKAEEEAKKKAEAEKKQKEATKKEGTSQPASKQTGKGGGR